LRPRPNSHILLNNLPMINVEKAQSTEFKMPTPGTYQHLEFLQTVDTWCPELQPEDFLKDTNAAKTLAVFIKRNRIYRPIRTSYIELDSRLIQAEETWIPMFHGSVYRNPSQPYSSMLSIHGQPQPWELGDQNFTYDLVIPISYDLTHDPSRPAQATIRHETDSPVPQVEVFNEAAFPEYNEDNLEILVKAINYAATDIASLVRYTYGFDSVPSYIRPDSEQETVGSRPKTTRVAQKLADLLK